MNTNDATGGYLGSPIDGVSSYKVRVGISTSTTIFCWEEAKQLAEDHMAYDPYIDVEIVGVSIAEILADAAGVLHQFKENPAPLPARYIEQASYYARGH